MRILSNFLKFIAFYLSIVSPAAAQDAPSVNVSDWGYLHTGNDGTKLYYRLPAYQSQDAYTPRVWVHFDAVNSTQPTYQEAQMLYVISCKLGSFKQIQALFRYEDGTSEADTRTHNLGYFVPGSVVEYLAKNLCPQ